MTVNNANNFTNPISVNTGGTSSSTLTSHGILVGNTTSAPTQVTGSSSQVLKGTTSSDPSFSGTLPITGITFGSGTQLTVYQEGTWTPTLVGATVAGTTTYTSQNGYYTKIGNKVFIIGSIIITGATGTGNANLGALPFTSSSAGQSRTKNYLILNGGTWAWPVGITCLEVSPIQNTTTLEVTSSGSASSSAVRLQMTNAAISFSFSLWYQV